MLHLSCIFYINPLEIVLITVKLYQRYCFVKYIYPNKENIMRGPKITVIGAGSYFFGKEIIRKLAESQVCNGAVLALVDIEKDVLQTMESVAERVFKNSDTGVAVESSTDYRDVIKGSDFIVLTFSYRNAHYRGVDTKIAEKHGIRMCSSDTIGPGGVFRALREVPKAVEIARYAAEAAPYAWVINFINPTAVLGMALRRYAPGIRSFALCDGLHEPYTTLNLCKHAEILSDDEDRIPPQVRAALDIKLTGVNHFTWLLKFTYRDEDMLPRLKRSLEKRVEEEEKAPGEKAKRRFNSAYTYKLFDLYGVMPRIIGHTKEYVPFFQGWGKADVLPEPVRCFNADKRAEEMKEAWKKTEQYACGKLDVSHFMENVKPDHASDIIESMWGNLGKPFYINTSNNGAVPNLAADAFLELRSDIDMSGPRPQPMCEFPRGLLALQQQVLDTHELTAEAAMTGNRALLRRAMLTDPICNNIEDAENCIRDLLKAEKEALPDFWY